MGFVLSLQSTGNYFLIICTNEEVRCVPLLKNGHLISVLLFCLALGIYIFFFLIEFYLPCLTFQIEKCVFQCKTALMNM